ncbi:MAG: sugar phosphate isomerase/epimerase [Phycisphaerales bacterium]|nr:sugar phosphate isomerase/epimerase [Phycisphaerales bacterium]
MTNPLFSIVADAYSDEPGIAARAASAAGFAGILFDSAGPRLDLTTLSNTGIREFRHILSAANVKLTALRAPIDPKGFSPGSDIDRQLNRIEKTLRAAADLKAPLVCLDIGPLPPDPQPTTPRPTITPAQAGLILIPTLDAAPPLQPTPPAKIDPQFIAQVDGALAELGNRADRFGIPLAFHSERSSFASLMRALRQADCPWFGINLDPVSLLQDQWDIDQVFSAAGPQILHLRARDALRGDQNRIQPTPIGAGDVDWPHLMANLRQTGTQIPITLDPISLPNRPAAAIAGRAFLLRQWQG